VGVISVLATEVADQIAAGEVVERPASVIKELVENALDAGASRVSVHADGGGLVRMRVIDDGGGMAPDDAVLCFSRHATSKVRVAEDLLRIGTFGFRGEALAAIASVARTRLVTRTRDATVASEVRVDGGRVAHVGELGAPVGTTIDVEDLFFNVPARRKFLKAARTELGHIEDALADAALAHPHVAFSLSVDGKPILDLAAAPTHAPLDHAQRIERAVSCLGKHVRPLLYPIDAKSELVRLTGYIVAPLETRRDLTGVHLSVNGRPVTDRGLVGAVRTAFRTLLEVGRQPIVALDLAIDPELVDVNVHPRKSEVRFADPRRVSGHVIALLSEFLAQTPWLKTRDSPPPPARVFSLAHKDGSLSPTPAEHAEDPVLDAHRARVQQALTRFDERMRARGGAPASSYGALESDASPTLPLAGVGAAGSFSALRVVGQVQGTFLILEGPDGMVVVDQHAAHERVVFERLKAARALADAPTQPLLVPMQLELSHAEVSALEDESNRALLARHGLVLEPFGPRQALIKALPPGLDGKRTEQIARDALKEMSIETSGALEEREDAVCARLACHAAVRAGDAMSGESIRALLRDLDAIDLGAHCPHGRPVVRTLRFEEMASWFDRT
jgi:DNA mismatch repair protein MutL